MEDPQITHLSVSAYMTFWGLSWGLLPVVFLYDRPKTPPKKSYSKCLRRTEDWTSNLAVVYESNF